MTHRTVALLAVLLAAPATAQDPVERAVQRIRADYGAIQSAFADWDSTAKAWTSAGGGGTLTRWTAPDGGLSKLAVRFDGDGASWVREYFFRRDALFFAFERWESFPESGDPAVSENRYYFADGELVRWLVRMSRDGPNRPQDPEDAAFQNAASQVPSGADCWVRFLAVPDPDWETWGDATGCAYFL